ncbi:hypothetical protein [Cellvibrio japonicus]|uniref:Uncharacterized protein n=1 Tax=Cellvibrio japonicus (strain Ueda107) TaxID=498211 RepID=B3PLI3_CELJU|nr:hypothetical protein [Cellvibrio japonicus]ACE83311.1 hypothetical protein CJA_2603 [Cellvibrio japonicus Ueda107]
MKIKEEKRNGHAFHPIMRKGGVHEKSNKAKRRATRQDTVRQSREWRDHSPAKPACAA